MRKSVAIVTLRYHFRLVLLIAALTSASNLGLSQIPLEPAPSRILPFVREVTELRLPPEALLSARWESGGFTGIDVRMTAGLEYIEFALDGHEILRVIGPSYHRESLALRMSLAIIRDNDVAVGLEETGHWNLWTLNRRLEQWRLIVAALHHPRQGRVLGFDHDLLLIRTELWVTRAFRIHP